MQLSPEDRKKLNEARKAIRAKATVNPAQKSQSASLGRQLSDFMSFRTMVSPDLLRLLFWLGAVGLLVGGVFATLHEQYGALSASLVLILVWRILCEGAIIFFRIHEALVDILSELESRPIAVATDSSGQQASKDAP